MTTPPIWFESPPPPSRPPAAPERPAPAPVEVVIDGAPVTVAAGATVLEACHAEGSFVAINNKVSQSVPHLHVHIVPRRKGDGLKGFFWPRFPYKSEDDKQIIAQGIRDEVERLQVAHKKK